MKAWWVLSVILVTLILVLLILAWTQSMPSPLHAISVVLVLLCAIALIYFVFGRW